MANNGEIVIRFEDGTDSKVKKVDPTGEKKKQEGGSDIFDTALTLWAMKRAANLIKDIGVGEVKYQLSKYYKLNDNYIAQQNMDIALNIASKVISTGIGIFAGAKAGLKVGGPAGAVIGASVAVVGATVKTGMDIIHNFEQENIRLRQMNAQLQFNRQRAGYSLTAGSVGENR